MGVTTEVVTVGCTVGVMTKLGRAEGGCTLDSRFPLALGTLARETPGEGRRDVEDDILLTDSKKVLLKEDNVTAGNSGRLPALSAPSESSSVFLSMISKVSPFESSWSMFTFFVWVALNGLRIFVFVAKYFTLGNFTFVTLATSLSVASFRRNN